MAKKINKKLAPALTPEARENQLIALSYDVAEKQLLDGTASSQIINHFLKLGSTKESLEKEILEKKAELMQAQTEGLKEGKKIAQMYQDAMNAMRAYSGEEEHNDEEL